MLSTLDRTLVPCVLATNVLGYFPAEELAGLVAALTGYGRDRDLVVVLNDLPVHGAALFAAGTQDYLDPTRAAGALTLVTFTGGVPSVELLGRSGPFGVSLEWAPRSCPYLPAAGT